MGIFSSVMEPRSDRPRRGPLDDHWYKTFGYGQPTKSGAIVNQETALDYAAFWDGVGLISSTVGKLPFFVMKNLDKGKEKAVNHALYPLIHFSPNPEMGKMAFWEMAVAHIICWGNFVAMKSYDQFGNVVQLWPIPPDQLTIRRDKVTNLLVYEVRRPDGVPIEFTREQVLHIPGLAYDGIMGYSIANKARESIGLGLAQEEFASRFFSNGANASGIVEYDGGMSDKAYDRYKETFTDNYTSLSKSHQLIFLEQGSKYKQLTIPPEAAQMIESRRFSVEDLARWLHLPLHKLKSMERATFSNIEEQNKEFVDDGIMPWLTRIEEACWMQLLPVKDRKRFYFWHNVTGLLRGNSKARSEYYAKMFNMAAMSPNDILALEEQNPVEGGDERFVPMNMIPLSMAKKILAEPDDDDNSRTEKRDSKAQMFLQRNRLIKRFAPVFERAAEKIVSRDANAVHRASDRFLLHGKRDQWDAFVKSFYDELPEFIRAEMGPVATTYTELTRDYVAGEVGSEPGDMDALVSEYLDDFAAEYIYSSRGQLNELVKESKSDEAAAAAVGGRSVEWADTRAEKIARNESFTLLNAVSAAVIFGAGMRLFWRNQSKSCPYCVDLEGAVIRGNQLFLPAGDYEPAGADGPMLLRKGVKHPPLHRSCDCMGLPG